ncbi:MAG: endonuclease domain-containing protein [Paludibacteraceae bacterium]|nr:endonuclease domain-containing protein [Paludibacteraceae bacterium]
MDSIPKYITARTASYEFLKEGARNMRETPTEAESILWKYLRDKQLGYKFRRQQIIDNYIVDFVCLEKTLIIEIDGKYHNDTNQKEYDQTREQKLSTQGYTTIRFTNEEITNNIDNTILCIKQHLR